MKKKGATNLKKFAVAILVLAIVSLSASLVLAASPVVGTPVVVNTAPTGFACTNTCTVTAPSTPGDCTVNCTWTPITVSSSEGTVRGYVLEVKANYVSPPGLTCPVDTVLRQTIEAPASSSSCSTTSCTGTIDLTDSVGLTGYKVVSFDASVKGNIEPYRAWYTREYMSASLPNDAASTFTGTPNPCP
jgi:hypothetical protein